VLCYENVLCVLNFACVASMSSCIFGDFECPRVLGLSDSNPVRRFSV
jgi:hypothetical protein